MRKISPLTREQAMQYALRLLQQRNYSTHTLSQKLQLRLASAVDIASIIKKLSDLNLLNDTRYAESFIRSEANYKKSSWRIIELKLRQKGISTAIIAQCKPNEAQAEIEDELTRAKYHADRFLQKHRDLEPYALKQQLSGYLFRKGFTLSTISSIVKLN